MVSISTFENFYGVRVREGKIDMTSYLEKFDEYEVDKRTGCDASELKPAIPTATYLNILSEELDFIGRFENLEEDYSHICEKIGLSDNVLPRWRNESKHIDKHYTEFYDDNSRKILAENCSRDIEHFGYEFGK